MVATTAGAVRSATGPTAAGNEVETWPGDTGAVIPGPPRPSLAALSGFTVGVTTERGWRDQIEALGRQGARVVHAPVVGPVPLARREALQAALDDLVRHPPAVVVHATARALESWSAAGEHLGCEQALGQLAAGARVVVGPGAAHGARAGGMAVAAELASEAPAAMTEDLRAWTDPGTRIAVQQADQPALELAASLRGAGFDVVEVPVCPRDLPGDLRPAVRLVEAVIERRVDAVTFIEAAEVRNLVAIAATSGLDAALVDALTGDVVPACLGRSCAAAAAAAGMAGVVQPSAARVGAMVEALASRLDAAVVRLRLNGTDVEIRGALVLVGGTEVRLPGRERGVLAALARRPGVVVAKGELLRRVWSAEGNDGAEGHLVEVAVARLRRRLGPAGAGLVTVPRRGYRLAPA